MYIDFFGLKMLPFENVPDPKFFFDHGDYARVHNRIKDSLKAGRGLIVVTGPIGSGKTTMSQMIKVDFSDEIKVIWIAEPPSNSMDLFMFIAMELGVTPSSNERVFILRDIRDALLKVHSEGKKCLVIIDESHLMNDDVLDSIRILNNLEEGSLKLIQVLLLGQEEIIEIINRPEMKPFKQRISALEIIGRMDAEKMREYILHRITVAGGSATLFTDSGWEAVILASGTGGGIPRIINSLCDKSINTAFERKKTAIDIDDVSGIAEEMGIDKEIFHYKVALRNKERSDRQPEEDSIKVSDKSAVKTLPVFEEKSIEKKESLKAPGLLLLLSTVVFLFSFYYYCQKSESSDILTCLMNLIGL